MYHVHAGTLLVDKNQASTRGGKRFENDTPLRAKKHTPALLRSRAWCSRVSSPALWKDYSLERAFPMSVSAGRTASARGSASAPALKDGPSAYTVLIKPVNREARGCRLRRCYRHVLLTPVVNAIYRKGTYFNLQQGRMLNATTRLISRIAPRLNSNNSSLSQEERNPSFPFSNSEIQRTRTKIHPDRSPSVPGTVCHLPTQSTRGERKNQALLVLLFMPSRRASHSSRRPLRRSAHRCRCRPGARTRWRTRPLQPQRTR